MSIPKIIHYCWFGQGTLPELERKCIASWKLYMPDYELMFWNEHNFDVNECVFSAEAYEAKRYAFVSDYVRAKVLYEFGGVYFDTDVEVLRSFDESFFDYNFVCGFETRKHIGTAVLACDAKNEIIKSLLDFYLSTPYKTKLGDNIIANVAILTPLLEKRALQLGGLRQELEGGVLVTDREVFYPKKLSEGEFRISSEAYAVHKYSCSWLSESQKRRGNNPLWINCVRPVLTFMRRVFVAVCGQKITFKLEIFLRNLLK